MNKKVLGIAVFLVAVAMLATPVMAKTYGEGLTVDSYTVTPFVDPSTLSIIEEVTGTEKLVCNGAFRIAHGTFRQFDYAGPLGTGTLYMLTIHSKTYLTTPYVTGAGVGEGVYQYTLAIDDGPYGSGTLKGIAKIEWELDMTNFPPVAYWAQWETIRMVPVEGDLDIKWVSIEGYLTIQAPPLPPIGGWWWTTTTIIS